MFGRATPTPICACHQLGRSAALARGGFSDLAAEATSERTFNYSVQQAAPPHDEEEEEEGDMEEADAEGASNDEPDYSGVGSYEVQNGWEV